MRACGLALFISPLRAEPETAGLEAVLGAIQTLEGKSDPKCHATASRLEDFMYGTPLGPKARFAKNALLKDLVVRTFREVEDQPPAGPEAVRSATRTWMTSTAAPNGDRTLRFANGKECTVTARDLRQYGSVAYSLRAILGVQQDGWLRGESTGPAPGPEAVTVLKEKLDLAALAVLQEADRAARAASEFEISEGRLREAWETLLGAPPAVASPPPATPVAPGLLRKIIAQKLASYAAYNDINQQLFVRNMQVYFARLSWPKDPEVGKKFRSQFVEAVVGFGSQLYATAAENAVKRGASLIREEDVAEVAQKILPHRVNEYEDVVFFPGLQGEQKVVIEAYDLDAFRDSGGHWHYLGFALDDLQARNLPEADPFAAELLAENIAQFGVLLLRVAGQEGLRQDRERLAPELLPLAMKKIQGAIDANARIPAGGPGTPAISSAEPDDPGSQDGVSFEEVTNATGIDFMHRSSAWLNRLLRSYLLKDETTGILTIPPAFGGGGVAAEDLNRDGRADLLLLSGLGNRLYLNRGDGTFQDVTAESGIAYLRPEDRRPGEPRQPLIADFDNDGEQDILITYVADSHRLYRGLGGGKFEDVTSTAGLGGEDLVGGPATTFDFDRDGLLDIYVSNFGDYLHGVLPTLKRENQNGLPNRLFRNLGGLRFEDVTARAGVGDRGWGQAATHTDFDGDGWQDLLSGNDFGVNHYYRNNHDGTFTDLSTELGTGKPSYTMSMAATDLNRDLLPDIYISNIVTMNKDEKYVLPNLDTRMKFNLEKLANLRVVEANDLFLSRRGENGGVSYEQSRVVLERGHSSTGWAWDADFFDADHDGDDDLYVLNGMNEFNLYSSHNPYFMDADAMGRNNILLPVSDRESNVFFTNRDGKLQNTSKTSGLNFAANSRSAAYFDLDADGDLDVVTLDYHGPARIFRNRLAAPGRNWIKLKLVGDPARGVNRDAIGAKVILSLPGEPARTVWREVHGSTGYMSVHPKEVHAGVGTAGVVDVRVIWPDGREQILPGLPANQRHVIPYPPAAQPER